MRVNDSYMATRMTSKIDGWERDLKVEALSCPRLAHCGKRGDKVQWAARCSNVQYSTLQAGSEGCGIISLDCISF